MLPHVYSPSRRSGPTSSHSSNALDLTFIDDYAYAQDGPVIQKRRLARPAGVADLKRSAKDEDHAKSHPLDWHRYMCRDIGFRSWSGRRVALRSIVQSSRGAGIDP